MSPLSCGVCMHCWRGWGGGGSAVLSFFRSFFLAQIYRHEATRQSPVVSNASLIQLCAQPDPLGAADLLLWLSPSVQKEQVPALICERVACMLVRSAIDQQVLSFLISIPFSLNLRYQYYTSLLL